MKDFTYNKSEQIIYISDINKPLKYNLFMKLNEKLVIPQICHNNLYVTFL